MSNYLSKEQTESLVTEYGQGPKDSGCVESQVAIFSARIKGISSHLHENGKDMVAKKSLLHLVGKRKRLLHYLQRIDIARYRAIIEKLGIRK